LLLIRKGLRLLVSDSRRVLLSLEIQDMSIDFVLDMLVVRLLSGVLGKKLADLVIGSVRAKEGHIQSGDIVELFQLGNDGVTSSVGGETHGNGTVTSDIEIAACAENERLAGT
jgi:hypothetical protein